ncbi:Rieske 2Fe-2S domain-containing protein [Candidatus Pacearchaeota archaeon]|nr:Rieske 2Fe-2S domain-containing protein [Desulfobulbaceae bacterium]MCK5617375.1 Rieske 2Fe-2S domain-containing protein [Candidatus Pacearchaeota archaeon]
MVKEKESKITRKLFLGTLGKGSILVALLAQAYGAIKAFIPTVLYEPPSKFKIGKPENFPEGITFLPQHKLYISRIKNDFRAVSAVCPHLSCVADWKPDQKQFFCSCHGSVFSKDGTNLSGPSPRPLSWYPLSRSFDSYLVVETDKQVSHNYKLSL